jgi:hypothetical protein
VIAFLMGDEGPVRATPAVAFFGCAVVSGLAAVAGVAQRCGLVEVVFERVDPVARRGLRTGALALFALVAAGALVLALGLVFSWSTTAVLFDQSGGTIGTVLGIWLLCLAYLPNAVVGALSYVVGSGFSIGAAVVGPLEFVGGPVPAVPLLAALPEEQASYLPLVLVLPGVIGVVAGLSLRDATETPRARVRAVLVAAITAGVGALVLAAVAGGALGGGVFNPVTIPAGLLAVLTFGWVTVPGAVVAWFSGPRPPRVVEAEPEPEAVVDEEDYEEEAEYDEEAEGLEEEFDEEEDGEEFEEEELDEDLDEEDDEEFDHDLDEYDDLEEELVEDADPDDSDENPDPDEGDEADPEDLADKPR